MKADKPLILQRPKLPVFGSVGAVYRALFSFIESNTRAFLVTFAIVFFLSEGIRYLNTLALRPGSLAVAVWATVIVIILNILLDPLIINPLLISAHRFLLLGEKSPARFFIKLTDGRELNYLYHSVLFIFLFLFIFSTIFLLVFSGIQVPAGFFPLLILLLTVAIFFSPRLLLVFPAIALDQAMSFRISWDQTKRMTWRLWFIWFLSFYPLSFIYRLVPENNPAISNGANAFLLLVTSLLAVATSTVVYRFVQETRTSGEARGVFETNFPELRLDHQKTKAGPVRKPEIPQTSLIRAKMFALLASVLLLVIVVLATFPWQRWGDFQKLTEEIDPIKKKIGEKSGTELVNIYFNKCSFSPIRCEQITFDLLGSPFSEMEGEEQEKMAREIAEFVRDNYSRIDELQIISVFFSVEKTSFKKQKSSGQDWQVVAKYSFNTNELAKLHGSTTLSTQPVRPYTPTTPRTPRASLTVQDFHVAARTGDLEKMKDLTQAKPEWVNAKDNSGATTLYYAVAFGHKAVAELLVAHKADVNAKDNRGFSPLHAAAGTGRTDLVKVLLANKADVNAKDNGGWTPLHAAAYHGEKAVVEMLLVNKADIHAKFRDGFTALHLAAERGHKPVVEVLLAHGADVNAKVNDGRTAFLLAEGKGHKDIAVLLQMHGT